MPPLSSSHCYFVLCVSSYQLSIPREINKFRKKNEREKQKMVVFNTDLLLGFAMFFCVFFFLVFVCCSCPGLLFSSGVTRIGRVLEEIGVKRRRFNQQFAFLHRPI